MSKSAAYVQKICQELIDGRHKITKGNHFTREQEEYLTNGDTLDRWAGKSLEERVQLFKRRYPGAKTTGYKIRKLYTKHKIRKKLVKIGKVPR